jgi:hypothetical protein
MFTDYDLVGKHGRMIVRFGPSPHLKPQPSDVDTVDDILQLQTMMGGGEIDAEAIKADVAAGRKTPRDVQLELRTASAAARGTDISMMNESQIVDTWAYNVFPNFISFTSFVGAGFYSRFLPCGDDPDVSTMEVCVMMPVPEGGERPADTPCTEITAEQIPEHFGAVGLGELFAQDVRNLQTVQQGLKSSFFPGINLALYQESLPRHMEEMIDEYLARP